MLTRPGVDVDGGLVVAAGIEDIELVMLLVDLASPWLRRWYMA